jgi:hypothetical protein
MLKKALTLTAIAIGAALTMTGVAHAEPNGDPAKYADFTADFVPADTQQALNAAKEGKNLIMSPYGVTHTIACRGTSAADVYDCMQEDALGWITLNKTDTPIGPTWLYLP